MALRATRPQHVSRVACREPGGRDMAGKPLLFANKMLSMLLLIVGLLLTATGAYSSGNGLLALGIMLLAAGTGLLIFKIVRRNESAHP
jgi:hypothetical protein